MGVWGRVRPGLGLLAVLSAAQAARAQGLEYVKAHYSKYEYAVPMRDGKKLFTAYVPKDALGLVREWPRHLARSDHPRSRVGWTS